LSSFTNRTDSTPLSQALTAIVRDAATVWNVAQRDRSRISIEKDPNLDQKHEWTSEYDSRSQDFTPDTDEMATPISPVCLFPKVVRIDTTSGTRQAIILCRGEALFNDSSLIQLGRQQMREYQRFISDAQAQYAARRNN